MDGDVSELVLVDLRSVDVDVDDPAVLGELAELAGDAVVEPDAEGQQQVGLVDGVIRVDRAVHAQHVEREVMVAGDRPQPVHGHRDGDARLGGELAQLFGRIRGDDAAAAIDDRPRAGLDRGQHLVDLLAARAAAAADSRAGPSRRRSPGSATTVFCTSLGMSISTGPGRPVLAR